MSPPVNGMAARAHFGSSLSRGRNELIGQVTWLKYSSEQSNFYLLVGGRLRAIV